MSGQLLHGEITKTIIGVFYEVHWELGFGFLESVYRRAMHYALADIGISSKCEVPVEVYFRGRQVGNFRADMIVESKVLVECKASERLDPTWETQTLNYLRSTDLEVALLLHFGRRADFKRLVFSAANKARA